MILNPRKDIWLQSEDFAQNDADNLFIQFCPLLSNKIERAICVVLNTYIMHTKSKF